jgi:outer membrane protein OmpA-like peptidoglycan-associated protein
MRMTASNTWMLGAALVAALGVTGCATQEYVDKHIASVDSKISTTQSQVDANTASINANKAALAGHDAKLGELDRTSRDALARATAAGKLAEGKFLYAMVLQDDGVKFKAGEHALSKEDEARLTEFADKLKADNKNVYLEVQGHTDATGNADANMRLGQARADAVRLFLNQHGVALNRISTISYGASAPVASNKTRDGRAQNRRVLIVVLA